MHTRRQDGHRYIEGSDDAHKEIRRTTGTQRVQRMPTTRLDGDRYTEGSIPTRRPDGDRYTEGSMPTRRPDGDRYTEGSDNALQETRRRQVHREFRQCPPGDQTEIGTQRSPRGTLSPATLLISFGAHHH